MIRGLSTTGSISFGIAFVLVESVPATNRKDCFSDFHDPTDFHHRVTVLATNIRYIKIGSRKAIRVQLMSDIMILKSFIVQQK